MRTSSELVKSIIDTELPQPVINAYILSANTFVTNFLLSKGLPEEILGEIEKWMAAHMIAVTRERMAKKEGAGGASVEYIGEFGEGLKSTPYGQTAMLLDFSGTLNGLSSKQIKIFAIPS